ncbi:MAG: hypothetical protein PHY99_00235 [Bacteroidales bacterium]|nr:hypothetical protein [Bacteroidales bacterium]
MRKIAVITLCGMLCVGASFLDVKAQNVPTGPPDTSVTARPTIPPDTSVPTPKKSDKPVSKVSDTKSTGNTGLIIGIIAAVAIAGLGIVLIRKNNKKK